MADGDGRFVLTLAESLYASASPSRSTPAGLAAALQRRSLAYDKDREEHYNLISALHKAVRGSDPDAALYWLARMLEGGEEAAVPRAAPGAHGRWRTWAPPTPPP